MSKAVFQRTEKKYLINKEVKELLLDRIEDNIVPDVYSNYTICNIYYDTPDYQLIRNSIEKPVYKEKIRLRSYGIPNDLSPAFLEIKKKYKGVVGKRRIEQPLGKLNDYLKTGEADFEKTQIFYELDYLKSFYKIEPKVYLAYDREAYVGKNDSELRITFDSKIRFRFTALDLKAGDYGTLLENNDFFILEIKTLGSMPLWLTAVLTKLEIFPSSFSKYGTIYEKYIGGNDLCLNQSLKTAL